MRILAESRALRSIMQVKTTGVCDNGYKLSLLMYAENTVSSDAALSCLFCLRKMLH